MLFFLVHCNFPGNHNAKNFADLFYDVLKTYDSINRLHTITADNASVNGKMAAALSLEIPHFKRATHLLGCVSHVINLAAQVGIKLLGSIEEPDTEQPLLTMTVESPSSATPNPMQISFVTSPPDRTSVNAKMILKRIHCQP